MPSVEENRAHWSAYDWPQGGDEWSQVWGGIRLCWYGTIFPRISHVVPAEHILEIAPGYGRCTQYLLQLCRKLTVVDVTEKCIEACRLRFDAHRHIDYHVNDGRSLDFVQDDSVSFVFSWDSLVHANDEVCAAYVSQLAHKLAPGGYGFLHHSNMAAHPEHESQHWRDPTMSAELFRNMCGECGLEVLAQEIVGWEPGFHSDAFSFFWRPTEPTKRAPSIQHNDDFRDEVARLRMLSSLYVPA